MRMFLTVAVVGAAVAGILIYLAPFGWVLVLGSVLGLFALLALIAFSYRDPHRHLDTEGVKGSAPK